MQQVRRFKTEGASKSGAEWSIPTLGTACTHCGQGTWFRFDPPLTKKDVHGEPRTGRCPCGGALWFYVVKPPQRDNTGWLYVDPPAPAAAEHRQEVSDALATLSPTLGEAYEEAVGTLLAGFPSAAVTESRRTLDGLVKHLLQRVGYPLPEQPVLTHLLQAMPDHLDLGRPLQESALAIRDGGNLGAHFDMKVKASPELAEEAVKLVEALVDYLLLLPERVSRLRDLLEGPTKGTDASGADVLDPDE